MSSTKQRICEAAISLFNEEGFESVSLRDIARKADTTIGNLTYHFPQKNDLLTQLLTDLHAGYEEQLDSDLRGNMLIERLVDLFIEAERNEQRYPFYFKNINEIVRTSVAVGNESRRFERDLCRYFQNSLISLREDGSVRTDFSEDDLAVHAYSMTCLVSSWTMSSSPYSNELLPSIGIAEALCGLLRASLTEACAARFVDLCIQKGIAN